jgi:hypothetical protein
VNLFSYGQDRKLAGLVDEYFSLKWVRNYSKCGSFELECPATPSAVSLLRLGSYVLKGDSDEAGIVEEVDLLQEGARETVTARGRFATAMLGRRIVWGTEVLGGDLSGAVRQLVERHMISPSDPARRVEGFSFSSPPLGVAVSEQVSYRNLLEFVTEQLSAHGIGIRTLFDRRAGTFEISLYEGGQASGVFSDAFDNMLGAEWERGEGAWCNLALVGGEDSGANRRLVTVGAASGEARREMFVDARDLQSSNFPTGYDAALAFRGETKMAARAAKDALSATVDAYGSLRYGVDWDVGTAVGVRFDRWGRRAAARIDSVTETWGASGMSVSAKFGEFAMSFSELLRSDVSALSVAVGAR